MYSPSQSRTHTQSPSLSSVSNSVSGCGNVFNHVVMMRGQIRTLVRVIYHQPCYATSLTFQHLRTSHESYKCFIIFRSCLKQCQYFSNSCKVIDIRGSMSPELLDFDIFETVNFMVVLNLSHAQVFSSPTDTKVIPHL